jgi:hypothetical protein
MNNISRYVSAIVLLWSCGAAAQSNPGLVFGQVPTAAQWNAFFSIKADVTAVLPLTGGTLSGALIAPLSGSTVTSSRSGSTSRTLADHFSDLNSLTDRGAVPDGATDSTIAVSAFNSAGGGYVPGPLTGAAYTNYYKTTIGRATIGGLFHGQGRIIDSNGNLLGPIYGNLSAAPTLLGNYSTNAEATMFNYDTSKQVLAIDYFITGASTLGTPSSPNYQLNPQAAPINMELFNQSGANASLTGNGGRTGLAAYFTRIDQYGQGDTTGYFYIGFVNSTRAGATSFLANPKSGAIGGGVSTAVDGAFLCGFCDINLTDNAHDAAEIVANSNISRSNSIGALNVNSMAYRIQSTGTKPIDAAFSASGKQSIGVDLTGATFPDLLLIGITMLSGGTGYTGGANQSGDLLCMAGGTFDQQTCVRVLTVDGSGVILTWGLDRSGKYSVAPATPNSPTGGTGTGALFGLTYNQGAAMAMPANSWIYGNAITDSAVFGTGFPSTARLGSARFGYDATLPSWVMVDQGSAVIQASSVDIVLGSRVIRLSFEQDQAVTHVTPTTGNVVAFAGATSVLEINPAGTLAALTVAFPTPSPNQGRIIKVATTQAITALTIQPGTTWTDLCSPSSMAARSSFYCRASTGDTTWYPY